MALALALALALGYGLSLSFLYDDGWIMWIWILLFATSDWAH